MKARLKKNKIQRLERTLAGVHKSMESYLLVHISNRIDATSLLHHESLQNSSKDLQYFVRQFADGHRTLSDLILGEIASTKEHMSQQTTTAAESVKCHVTEVLAINQGNITAHMDSTMGHMQYGVMGKLDHAARKRMLEQLLGSLKYAGVNQRRNSISPNYPKTFSWIFKSYRTEHDVDDDSTSDEVTDSESSESSEASHQHTDSTHSQRTVYSKSHVGVRWDDFTEWLESDKDLYWISGKPASGKSTIMKFIITHSKTLKALRKWRSQISLLSHFFGKPGATMQKSIKGFLCSLLYQIFANDESLPFKFLETTQNLQYKDSDADWDMEELHELLFDCLNQLKSSFCIFIDGLDEAVPENGVFGLMQLIEKLQALPQVKICVSCRPEQIFENRLGRFPMMRVQDLTAGDIRIYAINCLRPTGRPDDCDGMWQLINKVSEKAQGVFLWAVLAIDSLRKGIENGDSWPSLHSRLELLPIDLTDLYKDMWSRLSGDYEIYRQTACLYFNIVKSNAEADLGTAMFREEISLFEVMVASCDDVRVGFLTDNVFSSSDMENKCKSTLRKLSTACGGFLHAHHVESSWSTIRKEPLRYDSLVPYRNMVIQFTHRTAYDFLTTTEEGLSMLRDRDTPKEEVYTRIFEAFLVRCALWPSRETFQRPYYPFLHGTIWSCMEMVDIFQDDISEARVFSMLECLQRLCEHGYIRLPLEITWNSKATTAIGFLVVAGIYGFIRYVSSQLQALDDLDVIRVGSLMLEEACAYGVAEFVDLPRGKLQGKRRLVQYLLQYDICPNVVAGRPPRRSCTGSIQSGDETPWMTYLVRELLHQTVRSLEDNSTVRQILLTIATFINSGANLNDSIRLVQSWGKRRRLYELDRFFGDAKGPREPYVIMELNAVAMINAILSLLGITDAMSHSIAPTAAAVMFSVGAKQSSGCSTRFFTVNSLEDSESLLTVAMPFVRSLDFDMYLDCTLETSKFVKVATELVKSSTIVEDVVEQLKHEGFLSESLRPLYRYR